MEFWCLLLMFQHVPLLLRSMTWWHTQLKHNFLDAAILFHHSCLYFSYNQLLCKTFLYRKCNESSTNTFYLLVVSFLICPSLDATGFLSSLRQVFKSSLVTSSALNLWYLSVRRQKYHYFLIVFPLFPKLVREAPLSFYENRKFYQILSKNR